jgi:hypothetical protein
MRTCPGFRSLPLVAVGLLTLGCDSATDPTHSLVAPDVLEPALALSADHCVNFQYKTVGDLGPYLHPVNNEGVFGAMPTPVTIAGLDGEIYSWVESFYYSGAASGKPEQGAEHIALHHRFQTADGSWFQTDDRAPCSPAAGGGCRVNDQMRVVAGAGMFGNAEGLVHNHGTVNIPEGWLDLDLKGRICGDGLGG